MRLAALQQLFWRSVRYDPAPSEVDDAFVDHGPLSARQRMAIYRNMYWYRQVEALGSCFPRLRQAMGLERFTKLACKYIRAYPSEHGALEHFGRRLPALMEARGETAQRVQLCAVEWARVEVLIAPAAASIAGFDSVDPATFADSRLRFVEALRVVDASREALDAWSAAAAASAGAAETNAGAAGANAAGGSEQAGAPAQAADGPEEGANPAGEPLQTPLRAAAWRKHHMVYHRPLDADEAAALEVARQGATLAEVCALFLQGATDQQSATQRAVTVLRRWFGDGWIEAVTATESPS